MKFSVLGTTCCIILISIVNSQNADCVADVQTCAMSFQMGVSQIGSNNNTATCLEVNRFLECLDRVLKPCDLATRTSLLDAMNNLIDSYKRPPYNCILSFADNFTVPECTLQIGSCAAWDLQAEASSSPEDACRYHHEYVTCMNDNTTNCNSTDRDEINQALSNSTSKFTPCPYDCYRMIELGGCETTTIPTTPLLARTTTVDYVSDQNTVIPGNSAEQYVYNATISWNDNNGTETWNSSSTTRQNILNNNSTNDGYNMTTESNMYYNNNITTVSYHQNDTTTISGVSDTNNTITMETDDQPYNNTTTKEVQSNSTTITSEIPVAQTSDRAEVPSPTTTPDGDVKTAETSSTSSTSSAKPVSNGSENTPEVTESERSEETTTSNFDSLGNNNASMMTLSGIMMVMMVMLSAVLN